MRQRTCDDERGQATVEFALVLPFVVMLIACLVGVTLVCLDILRTDDLARTAARLASVSTTPDETAREWITEHSRGTGVSVTSDGSTVRVRLVRRFRVRLPLLPDPLLTLPYGSSAVAAVEPPPAVSTHATNVAP